MNDLDDVPSDAVLSVRGEAVIEVEPELARLSIAVQGQDPSRTKAMQQLDERARSVDRILDDFSHAIETKETTSVRVSPQLRSRKAGERVAGYLASVRHQVAVTDFTALGEMLAKLADQDMTEVDGPYWSLRPSSPVYRDARTEAAHEAMRRAQDYAIALGGTLGRLIEFADTGLLSESLGVQPHAWRAATAARAGGAAATEEFTFDIAPGKQSVRATVEARFTMHAAPRSGTTKL